jgi:hypothetical protein
MDSEEGMAHFFCSRGASELRLKQPTERTACQRFTTRIAKQAASDFRTYFYLEHNDVPTYRRRLHEHNHP